MNSNNLHATITAIIRTPIVLMRYLIAVNVRFGRYCLGDMPKPAGFEVLDELGDLVDSPGDRGDLLPS